MANEIRLATQYDVKSLTELFNSDKNIFGEDGIGFGTEDIEEYVSDAKKKMFVYTVDSEIAGALYAEYHRTYAHIESLIVFERYQKKGIGSELLRHFERDIHDSGITLIEVMTEKNNTVMMNLLEKSGFRKGNSFVFFSKGE